MVYLENIVWPRLPWSKTRTSIIALVALLTVNAYTELNAVGNYTLLSTYFSADFDSSTKGKIVSSRIVRFTGYRSGSCQHLIRYTFEVNNTLQTGNLVNLGRHSVECSEEGRNGLLKQYPDGKEVIVYFDSQFPKYSVLENSGLSMEFIGMFLFMNILIVVLVWFFCRGIW